MSKKGGGVVRKEITHFMPHPFSLLLIFLHLLAVLFPLCDFGMLAM